MDVIAVEDMLLESSGSTGDDNQKPRLPDLLFSAVAAVEEEEEEKDSSRNSSSSSSSSSLELVPYFLAVEQERMQVSG